MDVRLESIQLHTAAGGLYDLPGGVDGLAFLA
jgi:hypothetical protein